MVDLTEFYTTFLPASKRLQILQEGVLAVIQRKVMRRMVLRQTLKDGDSLNCNLPNSKRTMQKFIALFRATHASNNPASHPDIGHCPEENLCG